MNFIQEINPLAADVVIISLQYIGIVFEFLNVYNRYFSFARKIMNGLSGFEIAKQFIFRIYSMYNQTTTCKFSFRLIHQINTVNNKIEFRYNSFLLKIVGQVFYIVISKSCFSATLCMPNNSFLNTIIQFTFNGFGRKQLRITHDVFFQTFFFVHIRNAVF